jgi:Ala-tRNA(Pro) deacylase
LQASIDVKMGVLQLKLIKELLDRNSIRYKVSMHEPVYTSQQAARVRGVQLKTGVKALVLKAVEGSFVMGLVAADRKVDLKKLAKIVQTKKLRLASAEEVLQITGCEVGSVHPFGNLHDLPTYLDSSILENDIVNFNAGLHKVSIEMESKGLVKAVKPVIEDFSRKL